MSGNCSLHCRYYTEKVIKWSLDNKILILLGVLTFCLFISTVTLAAQRNNARQKFEGLMGDCRLSLKTDFARTAPVLLHGGALLAPGAASGAVELHRSETVAVACPGDGKRVQLDNTTTSYDVLEAHCIVDSTFRVDRWIGQFKDISCNAPAWFTTELVKGGCLGGHKLYRVGYKVKRSFYTLYEACADPDTIETIYVARELAPANLHAQSDSQNRPQFIEGGLFDTVAMSELYSVKHQEKRIREMVGSDADSYISKNEYLTRGHLAARADFSLRAEQRASFHYVNAAPQWRAFNSGAWAAIEDGLRRRVHILGRPVKVYTGTIGVSQVGGQPFYLSEDKNNNGVLPVPMYFYKLVYDTKTKAAVVFISLNRSNLNRTSTETDICDSFCEYYPWLRWKGDGNACCSYEAISASGRLPHLKVSGLFEL